MKARSSSLGFTLIELLISASILAVIMGAVYTAYISSSIQYNRQSLENQAQATLLFAMQRLKNDVRNAGRLTPVNGTTNSQYRDLSLCNAEEMPSAITLIENQTEELPSNLFGDPNRIMPDRLQLLLDKSGATPLLTSRVSGQSVSIAPAEFEVTDEAKKLLDSTSSDAFEAMYRVGDYLYIEDPIAHQADMIAITSVSFSSGSPVIGLERNTCLNVANCDGSCRVNPVEYVEYAIIQEQSDRSQNRSSLVRRRLDAKSGDVIENTAVVLGDFVIDMQIYGDYDTRAQNAVGVNIPADPNPSDDVGNFGTATESEALNVRPERLRALNIMLAVRTSREDQDYVVAADYNSPSRVPFDRRWFDLDNNRMNGLCRVWTATSRFETPNLYRGAR